MPHHSVVKTESRVSEMILRYRPSERACSFTLDVFGSGQNDHRKQMCYTNSVRMLLSIERHLR